jgi:AraC-like DNA-binding protein
MNHEIFYHECGRDALTAKEHTHVDCIEIIHICEGNGTILLSEQSYPFKPNDVFCFDGSLIHYIHPENEQNYKRNKLIFSKSMLSLLTNDAFNQAISFHANEELASMIDQSFFAISNATEEKKTFLCLSQIFQLLHVCQGKNSNLAPSENAFLKQIMNFINQNLQLPLSTDTIAQSIHMSKYYMCRRFKEETGITIGSYIKMQRVYLAKKKLEETDEPISSIALDCGFGDIAHFSKLFKTVVKQTPSAYRKHWKG